MAKQYLAKTVLFFLISFSTLHAQEAESPVKKMIQDKQYVFIAQTYSSNTVAIRQLNALEYDVRITADSIIASLPFYGQSYSAQMNNVSDNSIKFISTRFDYSATEKKNGKWNITIKPRDTRGVGLYMMVFSNGTAILQVTSSTRESMSFNGYLAAR